MNMRDHEWKVWTYFFCELMNVGTVALNFWLTDKFLSGKFLTYGLDTIRYLRMNEKERQGKTNPMCYTFPTMVREKIFKTIEMLNLICLQTQCDSVTITATKRMEYVCILSQNIINEKIYLIFWCWFLIVYGIAVMEVLYRITSLSLGLLREREVMKNLSFEEWHDRYSTKQAKKERCRQVLRSHFLGFTQVYFSALNKLS